MNWIRQCPAAEALRHRPRTVLAFLAVLFVSAIVAGLVHRSQIAGERRRYEGHSVREWVDLALAEHPMSLDGKPASMIRRIGPAAVPHLITRLRRLQDSPLHERLLVWQYEHLPEFCQWLDSPPSRDSPIFKIVRLLSELGPAARSAVPDMIRACDSVHHGVYREILDCLAGMGPAAGEAVPWLSMMANEGREEDFHAAWALWMVATNDTTFERMIVRVIHVQRKPSLAEDELSLVRDDTALNDQFVPLLAELLGDVRVPEAERIVAAQQLGERGSEAQSVLPLIRAAATQADSVELQEEIADAMKQIQESADNFEPMTP